MNEWFFAGWAELVGSFQPPAHATTTECVMAPGGLATNDGIPYNMKTNGTYFEQNTYKRDAQPRQQGQ